MQLLNLAERAKLTLVTGDDREIAGLSADSRTVKPGFLFVAIPGTQQDGCEFLRHAIHAGATAILVPEGTDTSYLPPGVAVLTSPAIRKGLSAAAAAYAPEQPGFIAAVTGTSGKTSTVHFTRQLWSKAGFEAASIGTLGLITPTESKYGSLTTPDPIVLHQLLDHCARAYISHVAMEASSHGIELNRLDHVNLEVAAFTNIARDHLDYHKTDENYFAAKRRLFTDVLPKERSVVLNADSPRFAELLAASVARNQRVIGFGSTGRDIRLVSQKPDAKGQSLTIEVMGKTYALHLPLIGAFQAMNALCALGIALASEIDREIAVSALTSLEGVPGRLQKVGETASGATVFVDYAHKPDALESVLSTLRPHIASHPGAKLHVAFGCGGNRDKGKRPIMGEIAQRLADIVIVTDDNPRNEHPPEIRKEILAGCRSSETLHEIGDRKEAIETAIHGLGKDDILVIAGKGHESGQIVGDKVLPFDDVEISRSILEAEGGKAQRA